MKSVTLTQLKNNFSTLMDLVKKGKTSLLVYERKTPIIRVVFAGGENDGDNEHDVVAMRLERSGLLRRAAKRTNNLSEVKKLRVSPRKSNVDAVEAVLANRKEDR